MALEPIPRSRALVPWQTRDPSEALPTFDPGQPSPAVVAFLEAIARDIITALGLPREALPQLGRDGSR